MKDKKIRSQKTLIHPLVRITTTTTKTLFRSLLFACVFLLLFFGGILTYQQYQLNIAYKNRVLPGIIVNNQDFSGYTKEDVHAYIQNENDRLSKTISITLQYTNRISTFSATMLQAQFEADDLYKKSYQIGRSVKTLDQFITTISQSILKQKIKLTVFPQYSLEQIRTDLESEKRRIFIPPTNALFTVENNKVVAFKADKPGITINVSDALAKASRYFQQEPSSQYKPFIIPVKLVALKPDVTISEANDFGIVEEIGQGVSNFAHSAPPRVHNIKLVSSRINGTLIPKGETFSFIKAAGEISSQTGFQQGYAIINGQTVLNDGGGVCQESTTLFRAALNAGLPIEQWKNHSYRVRYYEQDSKPGFDATVFAPRVDFKFKNDTPRHILIQSSISGTILTVTFYGKKDGRVASISNIRLWDNIAPPEALYKDDPTLPKGTTKQVDYAAWGAKAAFDYLVTNNNQIIQKKTFYSVYRPWQAVFLVGTM